MPEVVRLCTFSVDNRVDNMEGCLDGRAFRRVCLFFARRAEMIV